MNAETLTQLREILGGVTTAVVITRAVNGLLRARPMALAGVEESGRIWLVTAEDDGSFDELEREARVHLEFLRDHSFHLSVNGIATVASGRKIPARSWDDSAHGWVRNEGEKCERVFISVDPRGAESWNGGAQNTVARMFRAAQAYVTRQPRLTAELQHDRLLAA